MRSTFLPRLWLGDVLRVLTFGSVLATCGCDGAAHRDDSPPPATADTPRNVPPSGSAPSGAASADQVVAHTPAETEAVPTQSSASTEEEIETLPRLPEETDAEHEFRRILADMGVRIDRSRRTLEVDGWVNLREGLVEVFACTPDGKTHESVIVLDCVPSAIHAGLLALGLEPGTPVETGTEADYRPPTGPGIIVDVRWKDDAGVEQSARAEDWVWNETEARPMQRTPWVFAGSFMQEVTGDPEDATYAANYVKSLITTYNDASTILDNPLDTGKDDTIYYANVRVVPPARTPVRAILRPSE